MEKERPLKASLSDLECKDPEPLPQLANMSLQNSYLEWTDRSKVGYTPWSRTETNEIATDEFCAETDASKSKSKCWGSS